MSLQIKSGAIFLGDAHDNANKTAFLDFLKALKSGMIPKPPQIFLMGDMFDFLANTTFVRKFFNKQICLLNELSQDIEIFYFEGNHDFNLEKIFPQIKVFPISAQPAIFEFNNEQISISHGDIFLNLIDTIALRLLRNRAFLFVMNKIDEILDFKISKWILKTQENKKLDYKINDFEAKLQKRIYHYKTQKILEAHYHQGVNLQINDKFYVNFSCFALERSYFVVKYPYKLEFQIIRSPND
nr:UDP-2,3-diacylglucosamine diphosphatase [Campylobacter sp.]